MKANRYLLRTFLVVVALLVLAVVILVRLPVVSLIPWEEQGMQAVDLERSTLVGGDIYIELNALPTLERTRLSWQWCPGRQPLSWCVQMQGRDMEFDGELSLGLKSVRLRTADVQLNSLAVAGIDPALARLNAVVRVEDLLIEDRSCPMRTLETLAANAEVTQITLLGAPMGAANLVATVDQGEMDFRLTGDNLSGSLESRNALDYTGNLVVLPPPELGALFGQFMLPGPQGEYEWNISGQWTCG